MVPGKIGTLTVEEARGLARDRLIAVSNTVGMLATILQYAIKPLRLIKENPARDVKKPADGKQRRFLTLDEISRLGAVMRGSEAAGENPVALAAIRLLLLTGFRRMEALALPKAWIDRRRIASVLATRRAGRSCALSERPPCASWRPCRRGPFRPGSFPAKLGKAISSACPRC
jgi:integrase